jgi:hypothetical protein
MTVWSHRLLVGVLARLRSHLWEMTGLTIRALVSQTELLSPTYFQVLRRMRSLYIAQPPSSVPAKRPHPQYHRWYPSPSSQRFATTTALQPPAVADRILLLPRWPSRPHEYRCLTHRKGNGVDLKKEIRFDSL